MTDSKAIRSVIILTLSRLVVNMTRRFTYPFIPTISRQLGVPISSVQSIIALQSSSGLVSPLVGPWADQFGAKRIAASMVLLIMASAFITAAIPQIWIFALAMVLFGISKASFDPAAYAYLGNTIPYQQRGTVIGIVELSWAASLLIVAPLAGLLLGFSDLPTGLSIMQEIANLPALSFSTPYGLQLVLLVLGVLSLIAYLGIQIGIPRAKSSTKQKQPIVTPIKAFKIIRNSTAAMAAVGYSVLLTIANEIFFINYGLFMEINHGLTLVALGGVTVVISLAEFIGEVSIIGLVDRIGKRRMALAGVLISSIMYLILPAINVSLSLALVMIFVMFLGVEISIVAALPLFTEILPQHRATVMSSAMGGSALGRLLGSGLGGVIYAIAQNFVITGGVAMAIGIGCFTLMWWFIPEIVEVP